MILLIMLNSYEDEAAILIEFPSYEACQTANGMIESQPRMDYDQCICISRETGKSEKSMSETREGGMLVVTTALVPAVVFGPGGSTLSSKR